jgi:hypothetical protein
MTTLKPFRTMAGQWTVSDKAKPRDKLLRDASGAVRQWPSYAAAAAFIAAQPGAA